MVKLTAIKTAVPKKAAREREKIDRPVASKPKDDRYDDPADRVVDDCSRNHNLADVAAEEVNLAHDHCHDFDRRNCQGGPEKQGSDEPLPGICQHRNRQQLADKHAQ